MLLADKLFIDHDVAICGAANHRLPTFHLDALRWLTRSFN
jgi:hypothetical protein